MSNPQYYPTIPILYRIPKPLLERVDAAVAKRSRSIRTSRITWLQEAIVEKLERESRRMSKVLRESEK